jgi:DNA polymerase-3 subunit delta
MISELCGGFMYTALPEIEKIAAHAVGETMSEKDIQDIASPLTETIIYSMTNAISEKNSAAALKLLDSLMEQGTDGKTAVMEIGRAMRLLYAAKIAAESGLGVSEYMDAAKVRNAYAAEINMRRAKRFDLNGLRRCVILCNEAEQGMLRTRANDRIVLETLIYELCS